MALTYVLDTNVLIFDPKSLFHFEEHQVIIPIQVIEELDKFKRETSDRGAHARTASRYLDKLRTRGSLRDGVELQGGGKLSVCLRTSPDTAVDDAIIATALSLQKEGRSVTLVTRDTNMRIKADCVGLQVEDYRHDRVAEVGSQYCGWRDAQADEDDIDDLFADKIIEPPCSVLPNEGLVLVDHRGRSCLAMADSRAAHVRKVPKNRSVSGLTSRNKEQTFALNMLLNPDINLVTLAGAAGTGKTLIALAAALEQIGQYRKILVARPIVPMGKDIGFLPGTMEEKLAPWMNPIFDNLDFLMPTVHKDKRSGASEPAYHQMLAQGLLEVEALTYIRGRSLPGHFIIVDEAQNLTPHEVKTILTRAGQGTKIVLTGDPEQIDNPYVDGRSNGLSYVVDKFKEHPLAGHVTLTKGERSALAEAATKLL